MDASDDGWINYGVFRECTSLESVDWPESLHVIPDCIFAGCSKLKFTIPEHVTYIGRGAFASCTNITELAIPDKVEYIGERCFENTSITSINIPSGVTFGGEGGEAFADCKKLQRINFPSDMEIISPGLFRGCESLTEISIPNCVKTIGNSAFRDCTGLASVTIAPSVVSLQQRAFYGCSGLTSVEIPNSVTEIGDGAFSGCSNLSRISLSDNLKIIGCSCFWDCALLRQISLPEGLEVIRTDAFGRSGISTLTVPSTLVECAGAILGDCPNLTAVFWNAAIEIPNLTTSEYYDGNNSFLIYTSNNGSSNSSNKNVVYGEHAPYIVLKNGAPFDCPRSFTTDAIAYTLNFPEWDETVPGESRNWKTISLPFTVTSIIRKSDGKVLAPFNSGVEEAYPFWLRELTPEGYVNATQIEANKPYIIAMPNNPNYLPEYNITGDVIFSASGNVEIPVTPTLAPSVGPSYSLCPTYIPVPKSGSIWALNEGDYYYPITDKQYKNGSVFVAGLRDVRPFEAYITSNASTRSIWQIGAGVAQSRSAHTIGAIPSIDDM